MRYLGIDYGKKRIGLALSDAEGRLAFPYGTVSGIEEAARVIRKEGVGKVIVGLPITHSGQKSGMAGEARAFAAKLQKKVKLPIEFENEVFTTKMAERYSPKDKADASAAAIILQSYLDKQHKSA